MFWSLCLFVTHRQSTHQLDPDFKIDDKKLALFVRAVKEYRKHDDSTYPETSIDNTNFDERKSLALFDQKSMEVLYGNFSDAALKQLKDSDGNYLDVCQWPNITCDSESRVAEVDQLPSGHGEVDLVNIPPRVTSFRMVDSLICGTLTSRLPGSLTCFFISMNCFDGTVNFCDLPPKIDMFCINCNNFCGSADLSKLPFSLRVLNLAFNKFSGTLCLTKLPPLFETMYLTGNNFNGCFQFINAPRNLQGIIAEENNFSATAMVSRDEHVFLNKSGVKSVIDEKGDTHERTAEMLHIPYDYTQ